MIDLKKDWEFYERSNPMQWKKEQEQIVADISALIDKLGYGGVTFSRMVEELSQHTLKSLRIAIYTKFDTYTNYRGKKEIYIQKAV